MAYDEAMAQRIREALDGTPGVSERTMFGGLGFMIDGNMALAAGSRRQLMVRAAPADVEGWVDGQSVHPMEMRGNTLRGWLLVDPTGLSTDESMQMWVDRGVAYVKTLPPK